MPLDRQWQSGGLLVAKLLFTAPILDDLAQLDERVEAEVWRKLELVQNVPGVGTSLVDPQLIRSYGTSCLKIAVLALMSCMSDTPLPTMRVMSSLLFWESSPSGAFAERINVSRIATSGRSPQRCPHTVTMHTW